MFVLCCACDTHAAPFTWQDAPFQLLPEAQYEFGVTELDGRQYLIVGLGSGLEPDSYFPVAGVIYIFGECEPTPLLTVDAVGLPKESLYGLAAVPFLFLIDGGRREVQLNLPPRVQPAPPAAQPIAEPATLLLLGTGLLGAVAAQKKRRSSSKNARR